MGDVEQQHTEIAIVDERTLRDKIYTIRGIQVMLDFELAEIYGYETKAFNQQVRRNEDKFPPDFRFQLTKDEFQILRSQFVTSSWGGARYLPWAFSEGGLFEILDNPLYPNSSIIRGKFHHIL